MRRGLFEKFPQRGDVVMVGDSLTEIADWGAMFPGLRIVNHGISGDTTVGLLLRTELVNATGASVVAVMIGVNDVHQGEPAAAVFERYQKAVAQMARPGRCVLVQSTVLTGQEHADLIPPIVALNLKLKAMCGAGRCGFVDLNAGLAPAGELRTDLTVDGIHLNAAGYDVWRGLVRPYLDPARACH